MLLKLSSGECCAPHNFVVLATLQGTRVPRVPHCLPNEIGYGKIGYRQMKQCNNILQFHHVRAERLSEKRKL